jgi:NADH-quinone oxidoreductase subunit I
VWGTGILKGMVVTMRNMLRGSITLRYPDEKRVLPERSRWALAHKFDVDGDPKCTACEICVKGCPDGIITLEYTKTETGKHIDRYVWEMGACMFCGLCVESCPFDAIRMSQEYELATTDVTRLYRTLLEDVDAAGQKRRSAEEAAAPAGSANGGGPNA